MNATVKIIDVSITKDFERKTFNKKYDFNQYPLKNKMEGNVIFSQEKITESIYLIGDIHGDIVGLTDCLKYIKKTDNNALVVFLGDIIDRKYDHFDCFKLISEFSKTNNVIWLAGNHDAGLKRDNRKYYSDASPSECADVLNNIPRKKKRKEKKVPDKRDADCFIKTVANLPYALYLQNEGILAVHGSLPHDGYLGRTSEPDPECAITSVEDLKKFKNSYIWGRIEDKPNGRFCKSRLDNEVGYENIKRTANALKAATDFDLKYLIFGHQHPIEGYKIFDYSKFETKVVCIQSQYLGNPGLAASSKYTKPCMACYKDGELSIIKFIRNDSQVDKVYCPNGK